MTSTKNILISYGWQKYYPTALLQEAGAQIFYFADAYLPFDIINHDDIGPVIYINDSPILKNGKPAIPYVRGYKDKDGRVKPIYLTEEDKILGLDEIDLFIPYPRTQGYSLNLKILQFIEYYKIPCVESSKGMDLCMSKINTYSALTKAGISMPRSHPLFSAEPETAHQQALEFFESHSGQVILKKSISSVGKDIYLPNTPEELIEGLNIILEQGRDALIQEKIDIPKPLHHLRIAMSYGEVIAAQKFTADSKSPTSHVGRHKGVEDITLTPDQETTCLRAVKALGINLCSIDALISTTGQFYILEFNVMPCINRWFPEQAETMVQKILEKHL